MAKVNVDFDVNKADLEEALDDLEEHIRDGSKKGLKDTLNVGSDTARQHVKQNRNPFSEPHLKNASSWEELIQDEGDEIHGRVVALLEYAAYVDQGVSGTENQRDTPFSYDDSMPPLEPMIEWAEKHLDGWNIDTDYDPPFDPDSTEDDEEAVPADEVTPKAATEWSEQDIVVNNRTGEVYSIVSKDDDEGLIQGVGFENVNSEDLHTLSNKYSKPPVLDGNPVDDIRSPKKVDYLRRAYDEGLDWEESDRTLDTLEEGDIVEVTLTDGKTAYVSIYPEAGQDDSTSGTDGEIIAVEARHAPIEGVIVDNADYTHGYEPIVNVNDPDRVWESVDVRDLPILYDEDSSSNELEPYQPLDEIEVADRFEKQRIRSTENLYEKDQIVFTTQDNQFEATITEVYDDVIHFEYNGDLTGSLNFEDPDRYKQIVAKQKVTNFRALEKGDEIVAKSTWINRYDRKLYAEVLNIIYREGERLVRVRDRFGDLAAHEIGEPEFIGTREEVEELWADELNIPDTIDSIEESKFVTPSFALEDLFDNRSINPQDGVEVVVNFPNSGKYKVDIKKERKRWVFEAGFDLDGNKIRYAFEDSQELRNSNVEIVGVEPKTESYLTLGEGDDIFIDTGAYDYGLNPESWGLRGEDNQTIRATYSGERRGMPYFDTFAVQNIPSQKFEYKEYAGSRENNPGTWNAKTLKTGDKVTFEYRGETVTGRYEPRTHGDDRDKSYHLGSVQVFIPEKNSRRTVKDQEILGIENDPDFRSFNELPDNYEIPAEYTEYFYDSLRDDLDEDSQYYAWDYRNSEFIEVEAAKGIRYPLKEVGGEQRFSHPSFNREDKLYPVKIVAREDDNPTSLPESELNKAAKNTVNEVDNLEHELNKGRNYTLGSSVIDQLELDFKNQDGIDNVQFSRAVNKLKDWKDGSGKNKEAVKEIPHFFKKQFDIEGETRGNHDPTGEIDEGLELFRRLNDEIVRQAREETSIDRFDGEVELNRGLGRHEVAPLGKEIFDNPEADEYTLDENIIRNYSLSRKDSMGNGLHHQADFKQEEILLYPDINLSNSFQGEKEVWVAGGDGVTFDVDDLDLSKSHTSNTPLSRIIGDESFKAADHESLRTSQLKAFGQIINGMDKYNVSVDTRAGAERVQALLDEVESRSSITKSEWVPRADADTAIENITEGFNLDDNFDFEQDFDLSTPVTTGNLRDYGFIGGASKHTMEVAELPHYDPDDGSDEGLAIMSDYSKSGADTNQAHREYSTYLLSAAIDGSTVPAHAADSKLDFVAKEVSDGKMVSALNESSDLVVNTNNFKQKFYRAAAIQLLAGNFDGHKNNVYVTEDGEVQMIDLDHGAGDMSSDKVGSKTIYDSALDRATDALSKTVYALNLDDRNVGKQKMKEKAQEIALQYYDPDTDTFSSDLDEAFKKMRELELSRQVTVDARENMKTNIKMFAKGNY